MKLPALLLLLQCVVLSGICFAEFQNEVVTLDAVGTIGYRDEGYFTVVLKTDFGKEGDEEIGFEKTDDLQLAPMQRWSEITPGLAVRVTYEETRLPERSREPGLEAQMAVVLGRKAIRLVVGQKPRRGALVS